MRNCDCPRREDTWEAVHTKRCDVNHMSYKDYKQKPITSNLAPLTARPKWSKGDNPGYRAKTKHIHSKGALRINEVPVFKNNIVNISKTKRILKGEDITHA